MPLNLTIVTPESEYYSGPVDSVTLPGSKGQMEALPNHAALVTTLEPGELSYRASGSDNHYIVVGEGFVEINQTGVTVVTDIAASEAEIDLNTEEEAIARAKQALDDAKDLGPEELASVQATLAKSLAKINLKRRRHN